MTTVTVAYGEWITYLWKNTPAGHMLGHPGQCCTRIFQMNKLEPDMVITKNYAVFLEEKKAKSIVIFSLWAVICQHM